MFLDMSWGFSNINIPLILLHISFSIDTMIRILGTLSVIFLLFHMKDVRCNSKANQTLFKKIAIPKYTFLNTSVSHKSNVQSPQVNVQKKT